MLRRTPPSLRRTPARRHRPDPGPAAPTRRRAALTTRARRSESPIPASALAAWQRIEGQDGLLAAIVKQLDKAKDLARAGAVCRAWRQLASDDALWKDVCSRSSNSLLAVLKSRPGCTLSWRQIYAQHKMAARAAEQPAPAIPGPARSDFMIAVEYTVDNPDRLVVHSSLNELASTMVLDGARMLVGLEKLTSPGFGWAGEVDHAVTASLLRKSDSKLMRLGCFDSADGDIEYVCFDGDADLESSGHTICLNVYAPVEPRAEREATEFDRQTLTGIEIKLDDDQPVNTVEELLRIAERPENAFRWA